MKMEKSEVTVFREGEIIETAFGISEKDSAHILAILRDKLYTNKVLAVIREYSANAVDANTEAGMPDRPIEVSLPTRMDPYFKVRDYGEGLTEEEVRTIYVKYGASTKRGTNKAIGQLGLGSKAGFAYADSFTIVSFKDGMKTTYNAYIDETKMGMLAKMGETTTKEADGIQIIVPVRPNDISSFETEAKSLYYHFKVKPKLADDSVKISEPKIEMTGTGWRLDKNSGNTTVVMGGIPYPLNTTLVRDHILKVTGEGEEDEKENRKSNYFYRHNYRNRNKWDYFFGAGFILTVPIGLVSVAANREGLEYTENTLNNLAELAQEVSKEVVEIVNKKISGAPNKYEARRLLHKYFNTHYNYSLRSYLTEGGNKKTTFTWQGKTLTNDTHIGLSQYVKDGALVIREATYEPDRRYKKKTYTSSHKPYDVSLHRSDDVVMFLEDDVATKRWLVKAEYVAKEYLKKKGLPDNTTVTFWSLEFTKRSQRKAILDQIGIDESYITVLSTVVVPKGFKQKIRGPKNTKHVTKLFKYDETKNVRNPKSGNFIEEDIDLNNGGYYIIIDKFYWVTSYGNLDPYEIKQAKQDLIDIGKMKQGDIIYAVKIKAAGKFEGRKNWISLEKYYNEKLSEHLQVTDFPQLLADYDETSNMSDRQWYNSVLKAINGLDKDSYLREVFEKIELMRKAGGLKDKITNKRDLVSRFQRTVSKRLPHPTLDVDETIEKIFVRYPILKATNFLQPRHWYRYKEDVNAKYIIEYVKMRDELARKEASK